MGRARVKGEGRLVVHGSRKLDHVAREIDGLGDERDVVDVVLETRLLGIVGTVVEDFKGVEPGLCGRVGAGERTHDGLVECYRTTGI